MKEGQDEQRIRKIRETVTAMFIAVDDHNWDSLRRILAKRVYLDYSSMSGGMPALLECRQVIDSWKKFLPGFDRTHHQLGNWIITTDKRTAKVYCYGTASHYLLNESGNNIWTVAGSYDLELMEVKEKWVIVILKFNFKFAGGNLNLPDLARKKLGIKDE